MISRTKLLGLTLSQADLLKTLFILARQTSPLRYWRPVDLGGSQGSTHALMLRRMFERGLLEREAISTGYHYRISEAGSTLWRVFLATTELPSVAFFGGPNVQIRAEEARKLVAA